MTQRYLASGCAVIRGPLRKLEGIKAKMDRTFDNAELNEVATAVVDGAKGAALFVGSPNGVIEALAEWAGGTAVPALTADPSVPRADYPGRPPKHSVAVVYPMPNNEESE